MLKIGDKVKVTYADGDQFVGRLVSETAKTWTIDFDGEESRRIRKTMQIDLVDDPKTEKIEKEEVIPSEPILTSGTTTSAKTVVKIKKPKTFSWKMWVLIIATLILAGFAICVGAGWIEIGATGFNFNF